MATRTPYLGSPATFFLTLLIVLPTVLSAVWDPAQLDSWVTGNLQKYGQRKADLPSKDTINATLAAAEQGSKVIKVRRDGSGDFRTVTEAVNSIPDGNTKRVVVWIGPGDYFEKIVVTRAKPFVTFYGAPGQTPRLVFDGTAAKYGTVYSASVTVESDYFVAVNIAFVNSAPKPDGKRKGAQAVAMRISGDRAAFHGCSFHGFQDTLCDDKGMHLFKDCYIEGTVDFIFGNGKSLYLNTTIRTIGDNLPGFITAQARAKVTDDSGFAFVYCNITGTGKTYLGRAWMERPRVVFANTYMSDVISSGGWTDGNHPERQQMVFYAEYNCTGPGSSSSSRVKYSKQLTVEEVKPFLSISYVEGAEWLIPPPSLK
ncbi:Pectinesterase [Bertholletia excelsa]